MPGKSWTLLNTRQVTDHKIFTVTEDSYLFVPTSRERPFVRLCCPPWVNIIPVTAEGEVVLVRQYRHGVREITLEIPGGMVDPNEDPAVAARRELLEETGYDSDELRLLGSVWPNPAIQDNLCYFYLAEDAKRVAEPQPDPFERFEIVTVPLSEIPELIAKGEIRHSLVITAFALNGITATQPR